MTDLLLALYLWFAAQGLPLTLPPDAPLVPGRVSVCSQVYQGEAAP